MLILVAVIAVVVIAFIFVLINEARVSRALAPYQETFRPSASDTSYFASTGAPSMTVSSVPARAEPAYAETRQPLRARSIEADFVVPLLQAVTAATIITLLVGLFAIISGWSWKVPALVGCLAMACAWAWRQFAADKLLWAIEEFVGADINHDAHIGQPTEVHRLVLTNARPAVEHQPSNDLIANPSEHLVLTSPMPKEPEIRLSGTAAGYTRSDLLYMLERAYVEGRWSAREMLGLVLPSGRQLRDYRDDVQPFYDMLIAHNLLVDRGPRSRGRLRGTMDEAREILRLA